MVVVTTRYNREPGERSARQGVYAAMHKITQLHAIQYLRHQRIRSAGSTIQDREPDVIIPLAKYLRAQGTDSVWCGRRDVAFHDPLGNFRMEH
jgi:hypothetical protein